MNTSHASRQLSISTKLAYGAGRMAFAAKDAAFVNFVMFYYTQVLGVSGTLTGLAALIGLCSDAISDPIVGSFSDNYRSRYGRRHPLMAAALVPLAVSFVFLFSPPSGIGEFATFVWLALVSVLLRTFLTFFSIPHDALGAELSQDYEERSVIMGYKASLAWLAGVTLPALSLAFVFHSQDGTDGRLIADNYMVYGSLSAVFVLIVGTITCVFTWKEIPYLPSPPLKPQAFRIRQPFIDMYHALGNHNFRWLFVALLFALGSTGIYVSLLLYVNTYFWEFSTQQLALFSIPFLLATATAFGLIKPLGRRLEKSQILLLSFAAMILNGGWWFSLRLIDVLPANGDPWLFPLALAQSYVQVIFLVLTQIMVPSMVADIIDEHEYNTGTRKEGVFYAGQAFATKATTGFGQLIGGVIIDLIRLDPGAPPGALDADVVWNLGFIVGPVLSTSFLIPLFLLSRIHLGRERQAELRRLLDERRSQSVASVSPSAQPSKIG